MNLRIEVKQDGEEAIILISGDLAERGVAELEGFCQKADTQISLDLDDLRLIEAEGVELVRELVSQGVKLLRVSPYHKLLLGLADK